ncbi:hypothetical protein [Porphyromonas levii]|uniref:Outer membrane protein beta-barrel domain-containing protein n=1 Tax=Porphyromonas levii TaxID=28114 RepID=A0A4Y8WQU3_9PORP|nr:hypothetical protein [Porphyromonas levii]TFH94900.1 hypothetical protein E4P47_05750 [Porphyromonas levii]TFH96826.1 hypothetical protein E4P48_03565 [Porphyromonas levii]
MKHLIIIIATLLLLAVPMRAGENDWHIYFSPTYYLNPLNRTSLQGGQIGFEKELTRRKMAGFAVVVRDPVLYNQGTFKTADYSLLGYYKPSIYLGKNDNAYISVGGNLGSGSKGITFGLNLSLEYAYTFRNRMKLFISQDNLLVFRTDNLLISGISAGIKIPLNR